MGSDKGSATIEGSAAVEGSKAGGSAGCGAGGSAGCKAGYEGCGPCALDLEGGREHWGGISGEVQPSLNLKEARMRQSGT